MSSPGSFALLDDCDATTARLTSRLYGEFVREHRCTDPASLDATWAAVEADQRSGLHAMLLADYEWGAKLLAAGNAKLATDDASSLRVLMFATLRRLSRDQVDAWLEAQSAHDVSNTCGTLDLEPSVDREQFTRAIARIHEAIAAGETYQVNYTYRLKGSTYGSPVALYRQLRKRQPVTFGAFIALPDPDASHHASHDADRDADAASRPTHILSCSPELFLRHAQGLLTARPMKGTAGRTEAPEADSETARLLSTDIKNRAENLMIVDLLRNDLGRIAQTGSVQVPALFAIEPYRTVFQMTSTVQARIEPAIDMPALLRAVFPCGSITGAPKHHTMGLIAEFESTPRGLYCGAIGWVDAPTGDAACGDFCLSVAIRTLTLGPEADGLRPARLGIGAGIVHDSRADDEFDECLVKARFVTGLDPGFALFETMLAAPASTGAVSIDLLDRHIDRITRSAASLGFAFDTDAAIDEARRLMVSLASDRSWRVRLALSHEGRREWTHAPLAELASGPLALVVAPQRLPDVDPLSRHKTTRRALYDEGVRAAEAAGAFDSLFFKADGRLAEGGRSSVFIRHGARWFTPPLTDGALPGVTRAVVLADPSWNASERSLLLADVLHADELMVCNALRGARLATLLQVSARPSMRAVAA